MRRHSPCRIGSIALAAALLLPCSAAADAGPYGPLFAANGLVPYPTAWQTSCTAQGVALEVVERCGHTLCNEKVDIYVERRDSDGTLLGERVRVNTDRARAGYTTLSCGDDGSFAVAWIDFDSFCYLMRAYDSQGAARGAGFHLGGEGSCPASDHPSLFVYPDGSLLVMWAIRPVDERNDIVVRRFAADGEPMGPELVLSAPVPGWNNEPGGTIEPATGTAVVAWPHDVDNVTTVFGRVLDAAGRAVSDTFEISPATPTYVSAVRVVSDGAGLFRAFWSDSTRGGLVGRHLSVDTDAVPPTTTTTLPPPPKALPAFAAPKVLTMTTRRYGGYDDASVVYADADAAWYVRLDELIFASFDDGRRWLAPRPAGGGPYGWTDASVTDGAGRWMTLYALGYVSELQMSSSDDDATTWSHPSPIATWPHVSRDCDNCSMYQVEIAMDVVGNVVAAWSFDDYDDWDWGDYEPYPPVHQILAVSSRDGGLTWSDVIVVEHATGGTPGAMKMLTDDVGTWLLVWVAPDGLRATRSTDAGLHWAPSILLTAAPVDHLDLATDGNGNWIVVFGSGAIDNTRFGSDHDVYSQTSSDGGRTWGAARPVNAYAREDYSTDSMPSIATDAHGRWVVLWSAHHALDEAVGLDGDIFAAVSRDVGATWSRPATVDPSARTDALRDVTPAVRADERGVWVASWQAKRTLDPYGPTEDELLVAVAGDRCGDGVVDAGEQCDDGNSADGDGCDTNCTASGCGNGVVSVGESCDDGNALNDDDCVADCREAECGDGFLRADVEQCDDGNDADVDGCVRDCLVASCGDGFVHAGVEQCDDGNISNEDACPETCLVARCGDGFAWPGVEECDDGNEFDDDACVTGCHVARCGDGHVRFGIEVCDPNDPATGATCSNTCGITGGCGDVDRDGQIVLGDVRRILRTAIGLRKRCSLHRCDLDNDRRTTVVDASLALQITVGLAVDAQCPHPPRVVFYLADPVIAGALQFNVHYDAAVVGFSSSEVEHDCTMLLPNVYNSFNDQPEKEAFSMAFVSLEGITGPRDIVSCSYVSNNATASPTFAIEVVDASSPEISPLTPFPRVGYRFE